MLSTTTAGWPDNSSTTTISGNVASNITIIISTSGDTTGTGTVQWSVWDHIADDFDDHIFNKLKEEWSIKKQMAALYPHLPPPRWVLASHDYPKPRRLYCGTPFRPIRQPGRRRDALRVHRRKCLKRMRLTALV